MELKEKVISKIEELGLNNQPIGDLIKILSAKLNEDSYNIKLAINALIEDGDLILGGKQKIVLTKFTSFVKGKFLSSANGYGFIRFDNQTEDVFVNIQNINS